MSHDLGLLLERAWGLIANAGGGDWSKESEVWELAAVDWRDAYHAYLNTLGEDGMEASH